MPNAALVSEPRVQHCLPHLTHRAKNGRCPNSRAQAHAVLPNASCHAKIVPDGILCKIRRGSDGLRCNRCSECFRCNWRLRPLRARDRAGPKAAAAKFGVVLSASGAKTGSVPKPRRAKRREAAVQGCDKGHAAARANATTPGTPQGRTSRSAPMTGRGARALKRTVRARSLPREHGSGNAHAKCGVVPAGSGAKIGSGRRQTTPPWCLQRRRHGDNDEEQCLQRQCVCLGTSLQQTTASLSRHASANH